MKNNEDYIGIEIHAEEAPDYLPAPAGIHVARCVAFIQLGTQPSEYQGKKGKDRPRIVLGFEIPGEPSYYIQNTYSLILSETSTLSIHMEGWMGGKISKDFNIFSMLGKPCQVEIEHNISTKDPTKTTPKLTRIFALEKLQTCPPQISPYKVLLFQKWDQEVFDSLSDWMRKTIEASPEYQALDLPFVTGSKEGQYQKKLNPVSPYGDGLPF